VKKKEKIVLSIFMPIMFLMVIIPVVLVGVFLNSGSKGPSVLIPNTDQVAYAAATQASTASENEKGGGLLLKGGANFIMSEGTISGQVKEYGAAVYVGSGCTFTMTGGTIENCWAQYGGAIYVENGGTCIIEGGTISGNRAESGSAIYAEEGSSVEVRDNSVLRDNTFEKFEINLEIYRLPLNDLNSGRTFEEALETAVPVFPTFSVKQFLTETYANIADEENCCGYFTDFELLNPCDRYKTIYQMVKESGSNKVCTIEIGDFVNYFEYSYLEATDSYIVSRRETGPYTLAIPQAHNGKEVTIVGNFQQVEMEKLYLPSSIKTISEDAFPDSYIHYITIPYGVETIEYSAFAYSQLENVKLPGSLKQVNDNAFQNATALKSVTLEGQNIQFGPYVFQGCNNLNDVYFEGSVSDWCSIYFKMRYSNPCAYAKNLYFNGELTRDISLPANIGKINNGAFGIRYAIDSVHFEGTLEDWMKIDFATYGSSPFQATQNVYISGELFPTSITTPSSISEIKNYTFYNIQSLESVQLTESITKIGEEAFEGCVNLNSFDFGSVKSIGVGAFFECVKLESITLNEGLEFVDNNAFFNSGLVNVILPKSLKEVRMDAFDVSTLSTVNYSGTIEDWCRIDFENRNAGPLYNGANLYIDGQVVTDVTIPADIDELGYAFAGYKALKSIKIISPNIRYKGPEVFGSCDNLTKIEIGEGIKRLTISMLMYYPPNQGFEPIFSSFPKEEFILPSTLKSIEADMFAYIDLSELEAVRFNGSFSDWLNIDFESSGSSPMIGNNGQRQLIIDGEEIQGDVVIPEGTKSIGPWGMLFVQKMTSVTIPSSVVKIGESAFGACESLTDVYYLGTMEEWMQIRFENQYSNPMSYAQNLHINGQLVTEVIIPEGITKVPNNAFVNMTNLVSVTIPESVLEIGDNAFASCTGLQSITLPSRLQVIGEGAFNGCTALTGITIPDGVHTIGAGAFNKCRTLTEIVLPDSVTTVGRMVFANCNNLQRVKLSENIDTMPAGMFENCTSLVEVEIPNNVTSIGDNAFSACSALINIAIPDAVETLGLAFYACTSLESVSIGSGLSTLYIGAFDQCSSLTVITISPQNSVYTSMDGNSNPVNAIIEKSTKTLIMGCKASAIPTDGSVTKIGNRAFEYCHGLTSITIPSQVTEIGEYAFRNCKDLASVTIESGVTTIRQGAFANCTALTSIYIPSSVTTISSSRYSYSIFYGCSSTMKIYCERSSRPSSWGYYWNYYASGKTLSVTWNCSYADYLAAVGAVA